MSEILIEIAVIFFLMLLNGIFAMSELAVVSARRIRLQQMARDGNPRALTAIELADNPNKFLSTVQVGITLIGILAGAFGGATIAQQLNDVFQSIPLLEPYAGTISVALVVGAITYLSVVIGELVPKRIALQNAERIAMLVAGPMYTLSRLATPIVRLLSLTTDGVVRLLGIKNKPDTSVTEDEIKMLVEQSAQSGIIEDVERDMVESVFRLGERPLETMMTPRPEVVWLDVNATQEQIRHTLSRSSHSRFPICDGDLDHVVGVVRAKDLLSDYLADRTIDLTATMQDPLFAPENMPALNALERFKQTGTHLTLLLDEYGGVEGLVTLIDILEAIVGDIPTYDELVEPPIVRREDGSWLVEGLLTIEDLKEAFDLDDLPGEGTYQTLGGFVVFMLGRIPNASDHFGWGGYRFEVADMDKHRVDKVIVSAAPETEEETPEVTP